MPQLVKGGKWVFGWVVVGAGGEILIPPAAFKEYAFQPGETVLITRGSRTSGGIGIGRQNVLANAPIQTHILAKSRVAPGGQVFLPPETGLLPGERLLAVRGSGLALGFIQRGPIYAEALKHLELEYFLQPVSRV